MAIDEKTLERLYKNYIDEITPLTNEFYNLAPLYLFGNDEIVVRLEFLRNEILRVLEKHLESWKNLGIIRNYLVSYDSDIKRIKHIIDFPVEYSDFFEKYFPGIKDLNKM